MQVAPIGLRRRGDPKEMLVTAASGGHESDMIASMAGAYAGAFQGESVFSSRWVDDLEDRDELCALADGIAALGTHQEDPGERRMHRHTTGITQHAIGALVGAAVGDALGGPFEFRERGRYRRTFPHPVLGGIGEMQGGGMWEPAEFTDDTQMAIALAESLLAKGGFDAADLWERWKAWASTANDVGVLTRIALAASSPDGAAERAHERHGRSAGNGTIMRNTPVALYMLHRPVEDLAAVAMAQAALTHHDPATHVAAAIHAVMLDATIRGDDMFDVLDEYLASLPDGVRDEWRPLLDAAWTPDMAVHGNGTVWTCLAQAVWAVRHASSFEDAVVAAIDLGDDADTVGCVAGSLAGARWGIQAIPSRWTTYLNGWLTTPDGDRRYDYAALQELARRLLGAMPVLPSEPEPPKRPVRVHDTLPVYAADWKGATSAPSSWAIISLCRTHGEFADHPVRREVFLIDRYDETDNHAPEIAVRDAIDTIDALLDEDPDRPVLVHCHGGRSRTAFVLKAWAMRRHGWTEAEAHDWLVTRWPFAHRDNPVFTRILGGGIA